jgi:hypothetical protein
MMQELINQVAQRTGIPAEKAQTAVDTIVGYLKERLPDQMSSQLDNIVAGKEGGGGLGDAARNLGGMFGKK